MIAKIVGWFWIIIGALFLLKPNLLRARLQKKSLKRLRRLIFAVAIILGFYLIGAGWRLPGILAKIIVLLGVIAVIKGTLLLKARAAEKLMEWFSQKSLGLFRIIALTYVLLGIIILKGLGR